MALAAKLDGKDFKTYVILGDGECEEGTIWETVMTAYKYQLGNFTAILDCNKIQKMGFIEETMHIDSWRSKWEAFGWHADEIEDGHDVDEICRVLENEQNGNVPRLIIANTVKGKGVSVMENNPAWHFKMQRAYISALCDLAEKDRNVLSLLADSGTGYDELFRRYFPEQMLDFGIAEENMVSAAAGLASCGKIPFVYTAGAFLAYRSYEFIRDDICFQNMNVKIVGMGAGLSWSTLGVTHHTMEDLAALRALPNLTILSPACPREVEQAVKAAYEIKGPVYIKIGMNNEPDVYGNEYIFEVGRNIELRAGKGLCIYTTGSIASEVLEAAKLLEADGIEAAVVNIPTIKPFDEQDVRQRASEFDSIMTVEEHSTTGGIGSAVAEVLAESSDKVIFHRIGLRGCFAKGYCTHAQVKAQNALDVAGIRRQILEVLRPETR
jgi:transketolase